MTHSSGGSRELPARAVAGLLFLELLWYDQP